MYQAEKTAYERLESLQGRQIPTIFGSVEILGLSSGRTTDADPSRVPGLLMLYIPGVPIRTIIETETEQEGRIARIADTAIELTRSIGDFGLLNYDVRLDNYLVNVHTESVWLLDFSFVRRRGLELGGARMVPDETEDEWLEEKRQVGRSWCVGLSSAKIAASVLKILGGKSSPEWRRSLMVVTIENAGLKDHRISNMALGLFRSTSITPL